jgi:hypothetical protein
VRQYRAAGSVAREIFPSMQSFLDQGTTVSSDAFLRAFNAAARASFEGGRPRPIDYLHSQVSIAEPRFATAAQRLRDASSAGFPNLREYASLDTGARAFVEEHPFVSVAAFLPDAPAATLAAFAPGGKHAAAVSSVAGRARGFVYAVQRTAKSYAFLFVAGDAETMGALVDRFVELPAFTPGREGALVELSR